MGELVKIAPRGVELDGYVSVPEESRGVLLHFHGLSGNFYENTVVLALKDRANAAGYGFISGNLRGHDYIADAVLGGREWVSRGGAHTRFHEYVDDVLAWVDWAQESYELPVVVQGHSSGAVAVGGAVLSANQADWRATVLLSPADMHTEIRCGLSEDRFAELTREAESLVASGAGGSLLPADALDGYPIDASCWLEMTAPDGPWGSISWSNPDKAESVLQAKPTLVVYGGLEDSEMLVISEVLGHWGAVTGVRTETVENAGHSYRGQESQVSALVVDFLRHVLPAV